MFRSRSVALGVVVSLAVGCAGQPGGGNAPPPPAKAAAANPPPEPAKPDAPPAPAKATAKSGPAKAPWARALESPGGCTVSKNSWSIWFPCATPPERQNTYVLNSGGTVDGSYTYTDEGTSYQLYLRGCRAACDTPAAAAKALRDQIDGWVSGHHYTVKGTPTASEVGGQPYYEVQGTRQTYKFLGKTKTDPGAIWHRGTIANGTYIVATVEGKEAKPVFGKDAERFIRSLTLAKKSKPATAQSAAR